MIRQAVLIDLRVRMRSAVTVATVLVLLLSLMTAVVLCFRALGQQPPPSVSYGVQGFDRSSALNAGSGVPPSLSTLTSAGRGAITLVVLASVLSVVGGVIGAMIGAATIAGEYERETLDLTLTTQLGARGLATTRLLATFAYDLLLAVAMLPAFSFLLVFSTVPLQNMLVAAAVTIGSLLCGSAIGVFCSAALRSTVAAFLSASAITALLFVGGGAAYLLFGQVSANPPILSQLLLLPSPVAALLSSATGQFQATGTLVLPSLLHASPSHPVHVAGPWQMPLPFWALTLTVDLLLTALLLGLSSRAIRLGR